ncbi:MDR family MFS transporter [Natronosalvus amylolyticus]|uniref:MDR family MFS transporter n=1 Tax=Natronosalvus amylolyticus TaxID=2961994 RepID=UPI0020C9F35C|nr:MFS transporter [Natronosalvus amylolyticus]
MLRFESIRGFDRSVWIIASARFINVLGSGLVYPFATLYFYLEVDIPFTLVGTGLFANSVGLAVGTLAGGILADRYGRRPVMISSMALGGPALATYALVTTALEFIVVAGIAGLVMGLFTPASQAMIADLTTDDARERAYALLKVASNAGFGMGFVLGGVIYGVTQTGVFVANGVTSVVVAGLLLIALPSSPATKSLEGPAKSVRETIHHWSRAVTHPTILTLAVLNVGFAVLYSQMNSTIPVHAETTFDLTSEQLGTLFVLNPLVIVLFQLPIVARISRWRRTRGLVVSAGFWTVSFLAVWLSYGTPWALGVGLIGAFLVLRTLGEILHAPLITALASDVGPVEDRGSQLSVLEVAKRLGFGIGPIVGGLFFDYGIDGFLWPALVALSCLLALGILALERRVSPTQNGIAVSG